MPLEFLVLDTVERPSESQRYDGINQYLTVSPSATVSPCPINGSVVTVYAAI